MKTLKLLVDSNGIKVNPACSYDGIFPGMTEPLRLEFDFSPEWKSKTKVVSFWSMLGAEYTPQLLKDGESCIVPAEALKKAAFKVQILGRYNDTITSTNKATVYLKGGKA